MRLDWGIAEAIPRKRLLEIHCPRRAASGLEMVADSSGLGFNGHHSGYMAGPSAGRVSLIRDHDKVLRDPLVLLAGCFEILLLIERKFIKQLSNHGHHQSFRCAGGTTTRWMGAQTVAETNVPHLREPHKRKDRQ